MKDKGGHPGAILKDKGAQLGARVERQRALSAPLSCVVVGVDRVPVDVPGRRAAGVQRAGRGRGARAGRRGRGAALRQPRHAARRALLPALLLPHEQARRTVGAARPPLTSLYYTTY